MSSVFPLLTAITPLSEREYSLKERTDRPSAGLHAPQRKHLHETSGSAKVWEQELQRKLSMGLS